MSTDVQAIIDKSEGKAYRVGDVNIDERFWDCECEDKYIHSKEIWVACSDCGAVVDDMPDSRIDEITQENLWSAVVDVKLAESYGYEVSSAIQN